MGTHKTVNTGEQTRHPANWQWSFFALLQAFNLYQLVTHSMWRDELQTWSIVLESSNIKELLFNIRYDGFPLLWYLSLWGLSFISTSPLLMQLFHFACSCTTQLIIMTRAPFSGNVRLAIVAGYYISFEYCIISRAYVLGVLLVFTFCAFKSWLGERPLIKGCLLGILSNTSVYGAIISLAFAADEVLSMIKNCSARESSRTGTRAHILKFFFSYALLLSLAIAVMIPREGGNYAPGWDLAPGFEKLLHTCCRVIISLVPIPEPKTSFWNSLLLLDADPWVAVTAAIVLFFSVWLLLRHSARYLTVFLMGFLGVWIFSAIKYSGYARHTGIIFILLIACLWCAKERTIEKHASSSLIAGAVLWCILGANLLAWGMASYYHMKYDFSGSREMSRIIRQSGKETYPVIADLDGAASAVAGYLKRPFYYVTNRKLQTFIRWNNERADSGPMRTLMYAQEIASRHGSTVFLLLNYPLTDFGNIRFIARTTDSIVADEVFYLYEYGR